MPASDQDFVIIQEMAARTERSANVALFLLTGAGALVLVLSAVALFGDGRLDLDNVIKGIALMAAALVVRAHFYRQRLATRLLAEVAATLRERLPG